jgi:hypothetical protein
MQQIAKTIHYKDQVTIKALQWLHFLIFIGSSLYEFKYDTFTFWTVLRFFVFILIYRWHFRIVKKLNYTYWTFSVVFIVYFSYKFLGHIFPPDFHKISAWYLLAMGILIGQMYILLSPIYYPRVNWWEYDFRFRDDIKIRIQLKGAQTSVEGRMTDLRRSAACVVAFEDFPLGEMVEIEIVGRNVSSKVRSQIISKRYYSLGRGNIYGVFFHFETTEEKYSFRRFSKLWVLETRKKRALKYNQTEVA